MEAVPQNVNLGMTYSQNRVPQEITITKDQYEETRDETGHIVRSSRRIEGTIGSKKNENSSPPHAVPDSSLSTTSSDSSSQSCVDEISHQEQAVNETQNSLSLSAVPEFPVSTTSSDSPSQSYGDTTAEEPVGIALSATDEVKEIYLKKIFIVPPNHEFYCPNCNVCIQKVLFCRTRDENGGSAVGEIEEIGSSCIDYPIRCSACFTFLVQKGKEWIINLVPSATGSIQDQPIPRRGKKWEIVKSFVYGGLAELIASLSVVTSAASTESTTISIVSLAIANLIGGLILLVHNLRDLRATKPIEQEESENEAQVDKYFEVLGNRDHFYLHAFVAIISFLIFGLLPPTVYGFSFRETNDKDLKLAALAVASLIAITVLAIAKAYAMRSNNNFVATFKTVFYYLFSGALASLVTYVAGALMNRLLERLGWLEPGSHGGLSTPLMSIENQGWGSY